MTEILVDESYVDVIDSEASVDLNIIEQNNIVEIIENPVEVFVTEDDISITVLEDDVSIEIAAFGPPGPAGPAGPAGPQGPAGASTLEQISYVHEQLSAASTWTIVHTLNFRPNITVVDSAGTAVEGEYSYPNTNTVIAQFTAAFSGKAYLS